MVTHYVTKSKFRKTLEYHNKALAFRMFALGPTHLDTITISKNITEVTGG